MRDIRQNIAGLSPEKRALLARRLKEMSPVVPGAEAIPPRDRSRPCALSFAQQRLWFLDQMEPNSYGYNMPKAVRLRGPLEIVALREALQALVGRHEALRTAFVVRDEEPVQVVAERWSVQMPVVDLSALPAAHRAAEVDRVLRTEARRPFTLATDLMLRALLLRVAEGDHILLLIMHHIASDGWSMGVLTRELAELYTAHTEGRAPALAPLPIQYGDYAVWQRAWLQGDELARQLAYWKGQLAGVPTLQLPTDRPRPAVQTYRGARETAVLSRDLTDALGALSRRERVTLFMTLVAAFATLLHRYAGTDDVAVGTVLAGRRRVETEDLIGFFVNTLVLRTHLAGDPAFRELLGRVQETVLGAYDHQDLPFEKLVEELRPERSLNRTPLVQVLFVLQDPDQRGLELPGVTVSPVEVDTGTAKFDLIASVRKGPQGLSVTLGYNTDLYDAATIRRMLGHYETLLGGIVADPAERLSALPLLTEAERQQLLVAWNQTAAPFPAAAVHDLFEAQVKRTPEAVAVTYEQQSLTYRQLNQRANQLAHHLRKRGVGPDAAVGICLKPSLDLIVGLLGILKAGGAYVPLDPTYPRERLAFMLEDAQAVALVTRQELMELLPAVRVPVILLDADPQVNESTANPADETTGEHLAYLMYTSGSTGQPKAVAVPHRAVTRLVQNTDYVTITVADIIAQASNASFDAATFEIWGALLNGARLAIIPREVVLSPAEFSAALNRHGVTTLFLTTALFNQMAREVPSAFRKLRTLLFGGETSEPRWVEEVLTHGAPERLLHVYGPTEATTFACWHQVKSLPQGATNIPIGRPISNTQSYLLDRHRNPVPIGVAGELYIGGPGVARGYLRRPELTADKFIPDPFGADPGGQLYRTGDLARYLPDGNVEFLWRMDQQVKIRGHRIEPEEIEAVLRQHPAVREVLVLVREDIPGDKRLVAFLVSDQAPAPSVDELRGFLQTKLPAYMVPAAFVRLDALPLTPNGKVDRRALLLLDYPGADLRRTYMAPRDQLERQLAAIWEAVLGIQPVGVRDNFFDLGGHSLLAVRLVAEMEKALRKELPLATLFQAPTVEQLASMLRQGGSPAPRSLLVPLRGGDSKPPFFYIAGGVDLVRHLSSDQPCYAFPPHGLDGRRAPATVEDMAADYLVEIRALQPTGPYFLGGHSFGGLVAFEVAQRLRKLGQEIALLVLFDPTRPRYGQSSPPLRPNAGLVSSRITRLRDDVHRHWSQLQLLEPVEKLTYVWARVRARVSQKAEQTIGRKLKMMICAFYLGRGHRVPPSLRRFYFVENDRQATRAYVPQVYPGRAILFHAGKGSPERHRVWGDLAAGGLEIHGIPGDHHDMIKEPHVQVVAEWLTIYLHEAQSIAAGKQP